jgi:Bor protein
MTRLLPVLALLCAGCWATTIRSGRPPGQVPFGYDEKWHSGFVFGIAEMSGPYNLSEICPGGWAEVRTETSIWNALVNAVTRDLYSTQTIGIVCAQAGAAPTAPSLPPPPPAPSAPEPVAEPPPG